MNDLVKYACAQAGRPYAVFGTAPSMDGDASETASMGLPSGLETSLPSKAPTGVFLDIAVLAAAPASMAAAGFGDGICSSVARIDWWMAHRLLGTPFWREPYAIADADVSNHGSMGEHPISHDIDCFAGPRHGGTPHGQQVGVATLSRGGSNKRRSIARRRRSCARSPWTKPTWRGAWEPRSRRNAPEPAAKRRWTRPAPTP